MLQLVWLEEVKNYLQTKQMLGILINIQNNDWQEEQNLLLYKRVSYIAWVKTTNLDVV
jgi:hypothetical protein